MPVLKLMLKIAILPGDLFCRNVGASPEDDSGMLRGYVNSLFWGAVMVIVLINTL